MLAAGVELQGDANMVLHAALGNCVAAIGTQAANNANVLGALDNLLKLLAGTEVKKDYDKLEANRAEVKETTTALLAAARGCIRRCRASPDDVVEADVDALEERLITAQGALRRLLIAMRAVIQQAIDELPKWERWIKVGIGLAIGAAVLAIIVALAPFVIPVVAIAAVSTCAGVVGGIGAAGGTLWGVGETSKRACKYVIAGGAVAVDALEELRDRIDERLNELRAARR